MDPSPPDLAASGLTLSCLCSDDTLELSIMPKDEDILQLVSPSVCMEGPSGREEKEIA